MEWELVAGKERELMVEADADVEADVEVGEERELVADKRQELVK